MNIFKSKFMAGCQCLKRLYWQVHEPDLAAESDAGAYAIMQQGHEVGLLARQLFPGGVEVKSEGPEQAIRTTRELVANREVPVIFEATFENGGVLVRVDILQRRRDNHWRLIEVKSTTDLKEEHLDDVGIQTRVVSRSGLDLASSCLAHVNRGYVFQGGSIDVRRFFKIRNLTRRIERLLPKLTFQLRSELRVLAMPNAPDLPTGHHCKEPVTCEFFDRCNPPRLTDHIGYLPRINASAVEELEEMGVESISDIPDDFPLSERQRRACTSVQTGQPWFDTELGKELGKELSGLRYPLYFMDFESVNPAIPRFSGMRPFDQLPFQWSLHVQRERGAELEHYEFLATMHRITFSGVLTALKSINPSKLARPEYRTRGERRGTRARATCSARTSQNKRRRRASLRKDIYDKTETKQRIALRAPKRKHSRKFEASRAMERRCAPFLSGVRGLVLG